VRVPVHNNLDIPMNFGLGFLGDDDDEHPMPNFSIEPFLTGKRVLTNQTFRALFKAETIEVGTGMQIKSLAVLFTDLQASTAMYERVGDLKALDIVRRHFEVLEGVIARQRGAVVKTIGDAIMAVFAEPDRAMAAALEMIDTVRRAVAHGEDLVLKIGLHAGPCVAIQSNNQVDYFGRTVNIAARVQALASGGEIVCSEDFWKMPGVQDPLQARGLAARKESAELKGIGPFRSAEDRRDGTARGEEAPATCPQESGRAGPVSRLKTSDKIHGQRGKTAASVLTDCPKRGAGVLRG
jgi:class 3 adenylate cyclase